MAAGAITITEIYAFFSCCLSEKMLTINLIGCSATFRTPCVTKITKHCVQTNESAEHSFYCQLAATQKVLTNKERERVKKIQSTKKKKTLTQETEPWFKFKIFGVDLNLHNSQIKRHRLLNLLIKCLSLSLFFLWVSPNQFSWGPLPFWFAWFRSINDFYPENVHFELCDPHPNKTGYRNIEKGDVQLPNDFIICVVMKTLKTTHKRIHQFKEHSHAF